jgi:hypothetical protein
MGEIMSRFTIESSCLKRSYIRAEADRQARFAIGLALLAAAAIILPAAASQAPRVWEIMREAGQ